MAHENPVLTYQEQHLATDHLLSELRGRTVSSGVVTAASQIAQFSLSLGSVMILARLLDPREFGLVAMVTTIVGFLRIFNDAGLSTVTVQKEGITHAQVSNLFWTNIAIGGLITMALALSAPIVAWFYREPRLIAVTVTLSFSFVLTSATVQHLALLKRQMRFTAIAFIQVTSLAIGVITGIAMAWFQFGYWCLVAMQLSQLVVACLLTWPLSSWRPQIPKLYSGTRPLLSFGVNLTASSFLWSLARGSDALMIGRLYGPSALGLYSRAAALLDRPLQQAMMPLEAVLVPTFSRLQSEPERYRRVVFQVFDVIALAGFPCSALLLALAHPLTLVVLGPKWEDAAPIFAAFTLVALYTPIGSIANWLLASQARGRHFLLLSALASVVTVAAFFVGLSFGPIGVATANSLSCLFFNLPLTFYIAGRQGPVSTKDFWTRFVMHLPIFIVVFAVTTLVRAPFATSRPLTQVLIAAPVGLVAALIYLCAWPPARRAALNLLGVLREWKQSRAISGEK